jgi:hypothetical protein
MLERRLRKVDADVSLPELGAKEDDRHADTQALAAALGPSCVEAVNCPGCGQVFEGHMAHEVLTCPSCGTQSKVERRMVRPEAQARLPPQPRNRADFRLQRSDESPLVWDVETEQLCYRVLTEPDFEHQVALARKFEGCGYINATTVYFLPYLLDLAKRSPLALAAPICSCVGELLCQKDASLYAPTLETCEPFALDPHGSTEFLHAIGLGNARGLKLLIASADVASRAGDIDYASNALWAANTIIERNFDQHPIIAEIVLYRLLQTSTPVLGWMLDTMSSGYGGYVFKDPYPLLEFIDDCAFERPDLVEVLTLCVRASGAANEGEVVQRLRFAEGRLSKAGKAAALKALGSISREAPSDAYGPGVEFTEKWLDDPELKDAAIANLRRYISAPHVMPPAVVAFIKRHGETLPDLIKREVFWKDPQTKLLDRAKCGLGYTSEPEPDFPPAIKAAQEAYAKGIRSAVEARREEQEKCGEIWYRARTLDVAILPKEMENEQPTGGTKPKPPRRPEEPDPEAIRAEQAMAAFRIDIAIEPDDGHPRFRFAASNGSAPHVASVFVVDTQSMQSVWILVPERFTAENGEGFTFQPLPGLVYGVVPPGFRQETPDRGDAPALLPGRVYTIAVTGEASMGQFEFTVRGSQSVADAVK